MINQAMLLGHVFGAAALAAALGIEGAALGHLQRARTPDDVAAPLALTRIATRLYGAAWLLLVGCGTYLAASVWGWHGWLVVALTSTLALPFLGAMVAGPRMQRYAERVASEQSSERGGGVTADPALRLVYRLRLGIAAAVLWMMVVKPWTSGAVSTLVGFLLLAWLSTLASRRRIDRRPVQRPQIDR